MGNGLDRIGILAGTDKSSITLGYLRHYERLLAPLRQQPITVVEIGIHRGASLTMWSEYFEKATIVGVDIQENCLKYATDRCKVEIGSQADPIFLDALGNKWRPHVIIDDGSHWAGHVLLTFRTLFPYLGEGGIYVVEDVHFHGGRFAHLWSDPNDENPLDFFSKFAKVVCCPDLTSEIDRSLIPAVDSIEFFYGAVVIKKKPPAEHDGVAVRRPLVEQANKAEVWSGFAYYVMNHCRDISYAESCARRAISLDPKAAEYHHVLGVILERAGNLIGAHDAASQALALNPSEFFMTRLTDLKKVMALGGQS